MSAQAFDQSKRRGVLRTRRTAASAALGDGDVSDETLIAAMAEGSQAAAVAFVRRYQRRIFGLAYGLIGDSGLAEEVAQEALVRVWRHATVFDPRRGSARTWVLTVTRNLAIDAMRVRRGIPYSPADVDRLVGEDYRAESAIGNLVSATTLKDALSELPEEQRRALVLASIYGYTAAQIAKSESIPLGTAKSRIRIGLLKLQQRLTEEPELP